MELKTIITISVILISINFTLMGLGLFSPTDISKPFTLFTGDIEQGINSGQPQIYTPDIPDNSVATDSYTSVPRYESQNYLEQSSTIKYILLGSVFGYTAILNSLGLPYLIVLLLISIVTIFQVVGFVYFIAWGWSAMFGGGV